MQVEWHSTTLLGPWKVPGSLVPGTMHNHGIILTHLVGMSSLSVYIRGKFKQSTQSNDHRSPAVYTKYTVNQESGMF